MANETEILEDRHLIADSRGAYAEAARFRERGRTDRMRSGNVLIDDSLEYCFLSCCQCHIDGPVRRSLALFYAEC